MSKHVAAAVVSVVIAAAALLTQSLVTAQAAPTFEVVSIKPNTSAELGARVSAQPSGRLIITNVPVSALVIYAFELVDYFQIDGLPEWTQTEKIDLVAQAPAGVPVAFPGQGTATPRMLQAMLADRLKLKTHWEKRMTPMFALVKARADDSVRPSLTQSAIDCTTAPSRPPSEANAEPRPGECGIRITIDSFSAHGIPLDRMIRLVLSPRVRRPVVDRTGLTGTFDINLRFRAPEPPPGAVAAGLVFSATDPDLPPIEIAVQEQLGLRLEPIRDQMNVLVLDDIQRPDPD